MRRVLLYLGLAREGDDWQLPRNAYGALAMLGALIGVALLIGGAMVVGVFMVLLAIWMLAIYAARSR
ncbi:MAG TPA: hypothetical protein VGM33_18960 [Baekduia sp.]|jgi:hypothetical protein